MEETVDIDEYVIVRRGGLAEEEMGDELVAFCAETGWVYGFNKPAYYAWMFLKEPLTFSAWKQAIIRTFRVDSDTCDKQLKELLRDFEAAGLVTLTLADPPTVDVLSESVGSTKVTPRHSAIRRAKFWARLWRRTPANRGH